jgi:hypothetical protein
VEYSTAEPRIPNSTDFRITSVLLAVFAETHRGGHIFFSYDDEKAFDEITPLLEIYQAVDRG